MVEQLSHDHDVIIFTGMNPDFKSIREKNLRDLVMNIKNVVAVANSRDFNAKEKYAREVNAKFFSLTTYCNTLLAFKIFRQN